MVIKQISNKHKALYRLRVKDFDKTITPCVDLGAPRPEMKNHRHGDETLKSQRTPVFTHYSFPIFDPQVSDTYYVPFEEVMPKAKDIDPLRMISYYQWVPIILLSQVTQHTTYIFYTALTRISLAISNTTVEHSKKG